MAQSLLKVASEDHTRTLVAEAPISTLFPTAGAPRAADQSARPAPSAKPVQNKQPSKFERELKARGSEHTSTSAKPTKDPGLKSAPEQADRQVLRSLRKIAAKNKQAVDNTPVVALLTGKLDRLPDSSIPDLVSSNEFVTNALSEGELEGFMSKPMPIGNMLESLGMPPAVLAEAEQLGLDLAAIVSPNEILRALGLDPQRIFAELKQLKDNLSLDGLQGYMQRAAMMQRGADAAVRADALQQDRLNREAEAARAAAERFPRRAIAEINLGNSLAKNSSIQSPQVEANTTSQSLAMGVTLDQLTPWQVTSGLAARVAQPDGLTSQATSNARLGDPTLNVSLNSLNSTSMSGYFANIAKMQAAEVGYDQTLANSRLIQDLASGDFEAPALIETSSSAVTSGLGGNPAFNRASYDAFAAMGMQLRDADTIRIKDPSELSQPLLSTTESATTGGQTSPDRSLALDDLLRNLTNQPSDRLDLGNNQSANVARVNTPGFAHTLLPNGLKLAQDAASITQAAAISEQATNANQMDLKDLNNRDRGQSDGNWLSMFTSKATDLTAPLTQRISIDDLARGLTLDQAKSDPLHDTESEDSQTPDSSAGFDPTRGLETLNSNSQNSSKASQSHSFANHLAAPQAVMSPQERADIMRQVIDRATFLANDGGGIVRLDISNPEVGPLELAVNLQNDRLDLRILTASDRARDIMAGEMSQLRDALSIQNLQLGSVEVGVGKRDSERSNDLFSAFQQNASARQFGDSDERR